MNEDREHLRLLSIFHWIVAGLAALSALFPIVHLLIGVSMVSGGMSPEFKSGRNDFPVEVVGWFFIVFACIWMLCGFTLALCLASAARFLADHRRRTFCIVVAAVTCVFFPFGTALGVFTLIVLNRNSVRELFAASSGTAVSG